MSDRYKSSVFLPKTPFPMKANLPSKEPIILERWKSMDLYSRLRHQSVGKKKFVLHDGPPYANGHLHMGHALNKILKDVIMKSRQMSGFDVPYVPGWDCHGLPIEWQIEEQYRKKGKSKEDVSVIEFRKACRDDAKKWIGVQKEEFKRLGVIGDWENPYTTLAPEAEATIVEELIKFLMKGDIYIGEKPVMWSVVEKTALAEAEVEYKEKTSSSIYVKFPVVTTSNKNLEAVCAVIWTTTPWTLPANRAIAYAPEAEYVVIEIESAVQEEGIGASKGDKLLLAKELLPAVTDMAKIEKYKTLATLNGKELKGTICHHPLYEEGIKFDIPLLPGEHVTLEQGTGLVHTAPAHGVEDFQVGKEHNLEVAKTMGDDGVFFDHVPVLAGTHVFKADPIMLEALTKAGALVSSNQIVHSYPHSWRSKAPLIYRTTPQWFLSMEENKLREVALNAIDNDVNWVPAQSKNRIRSMVESRPDWCLSRQRAWGVPLPFFVHKVSGEILKDEKTNARIIDIIRAEGTDAWYKRASQDFLSDAHDSDDWKKITDVVDVWFDSGTTQNFVLEKREELAWPADLYVEGSDQHRGWFQSSLLVACGTKGHAPYKTVLTHGFVLDDKGYKLSKSMGNAVSLETIIKDYGVDILRLWAINSDYQDDLRIGKDILRLQQDIYRRFRNTFRYLLGSLVGYDEKKEVLAYDDLPELEKYICHRLFELQKLFDRAMENYSFQEFLNALHNFCAVDLSAFYFDIRKDALYCDATDSIRRRAARTVMHDLLNYLMRWLAPILVFTTEEVYLAWLEQKGEDTSEKSIHLENFVQPPEKWEDLAVYEKWSRIRHLRRVMTGALEKSRSDGLIGSSLQADIQIYGNYENLQYFEKQDVAEIAIVSQAIMIEGEVPGEAFTLDDVRGIGVLVAQAQGEKCVRCWKILKEVGEDKGFKDLCQRCAKVVENLEVA